MEHTQDAEEDVAKGVDRNLREGKDAPAGRMDADQKGLANPSGRMNERAAKEDPQSLSHAGKAKRVTGPSWRRCSSSCAMYVPRKSLLVL